MLKELKNNPSLKGADSFLISSSQNIYYLTGYNGFSKEEREALVLLTKDNNYILTDRRYLNELSDLKNFELIEISSANPVVMALLNLIAKNGLKKAVFEADNLTLSEYEKYKKIFKSFKPASGIIEKLRGIKNEEEIRNIKNACRISDLAFSRIVKSIKQGITEKELALSLEIFIRQKGAEIAFKPIVAFGQNSAVPHHLNSDKRLKKGDIVLLDFGAKVNGYCSDMTRTVFFGKPDGKFLDIYQTVFKAQQNAVRQFNNLSVKKSKKGIKASDIDKAARDFIVSKGFSAIPHSVGHGIGIDVHELPALSPGSKDILKSGMIFSIEPGIYVNGFGGVRIEDLFLLTENSLEKITHSTSEILKL